MAAMGSYQRKEVLEHCVREFEARFEDLAVSLCIEAGKPIKVHYPFDLPSVTDYLRRYICGALGRALLEKPSRGA